MKKVTLLFAILILSALASGAYAYTEGKFDEILGLVDDDDNDDQLESENQPPVAKITPPNPKIQINETISFSGSDSTDPDGDELTYVWSFEGDSKNYEGMDVERNYPEKGEYLVTLEVTDSAGLSHSTQTTVLVVEDYHDEQSGNVNGNDDTENIEFPVNSGFVSVRVEFSLDSASINPLEDSRVTLRLTDADGVVVNEENDMGEGDDGVWTYDSSDLSSNGEYIFTIESESGSMDFDVTIDVAY